MRELLRLAPGAETDIDGHVVARLPVARIDIYPGVAQAHGLDLLAVLADRAVQERKDALIDSEIINVGWTTSVS
ncbi:hypothetical protein [Bradyrhizobium sp.]|uniref:hypothetical protein n=1 Tax=Bradyrhizobium sp. TaxID=376 RepID=UPI002630113F|nr:hypothetical protein [Bradyrhizobium sp.]